MLVLLFVFSQSNSDLEIFFTVLSDSLISHDEISPRALSHMKGGKKKDSTLGIIVLFFISFIGYFVILNQNS